MAASFVRQKISKSFAGKAPVNRILTEVSGMLESVSITEGRKRNYSVLEENTLDKKIAVQQVESYPSSSTFVTKQVISLPHAFIGSQSFRHCVTAHTTQSCWHCGRSLNIELEQYFCDCGVIQPPGERNLFDVMGMPSSFDVDQGLLTKRFRDLQKILHPDKFSQKSDIELAYSAQQSSLVNKAYVTLQKPLPRGLYMLELCGETFDESEGNSSDPELLMEIMDINEKLANATNKETVLDIGKKNKEMVDKLVSRISGAFNNKDCHAAKILLSKLKYYANIDEKVKELDQRFSGIV